MGGFSDYTAQATINSLLLGSAMPEIDGLHLALFTADPKDDNSGAANEVSAGWYQRQPCDSWTAPVSNADGVTGTQTANSAQVTFPATTGASVTISHWGLYDAETGGNLLFSGALTTPRTLNVSDVMTLGVGQLTMLFS